MKVSPNDPCPCGSATKLKRCCRKMHRGLLAPDPETLMRSRYTAYALQEVDYVLDTTHPEGPHQRADREAWFEEVRTFSEATTFQRLEVLDASQRGDEAWVTFRAHLVQGGEDASFSERSRFVRVGERWLYHSGEGL